MSKKWYVLSQKSESDIDVIFLFPGNGSQKNQKK